MTADLTKLVRLFAGGESMGANLLIDMKSLYESMMGMSKCHEAYVKMIVYLVRVIF